VRLEQPLVALLKNKGVKKMKIKRIEKEKPFKVEGVVFYLSKPTTPDLVTFSMLSENKSKSEGFKEGVTFILSKITRIENLEYEDGTKITDASELDVIDIGMDIIQELITKYADWVSSIFSDRKKKRKKKK
jgi:hypothetical protein